MEIKSDIFKLNGVVLEVTNRDKTFEEYRKEAMIIAIKENVNVHFTFVNETFVIDVNKVFNSLDKSTDEIREVTTENTVKPEQKEENNIVRGTSGDDSHPVAVVTSVIRNNPKTSYGKGGRQNNDIIRD